MHPISLGRAPAPLISLGPSLSQSIYQDNEEEKLKGVYSLIKYATLCKFMLIPTEELSLNKLSLGKESTKPPAFIPGYGERGWHAAPGYPNHVSSPKPLIQTPSMIELVS